MQLFTEKERENSPLYLKDQIDDLLSAGEGAPYPVMNLLAGIVSSRYKDAYEQASRREYARGRDIGTPEQFYSGNNPYAFPYIRGVRRQPVSGLDNLSEYFGGSVPRTVGEIQDFVLGSMVAPILPSAAYFETERRSNDFGNAVQDMMLGITKSIYTYDPKRSRSFQYYAVQKGYIEAIGAARAENRERDLLDILSGRIDPSTSRDTGAMSSLERAIQAYDQGIPGARAALQDVLGGIGIDAGNIARIKNNLLTPWRPLTGLDPSSLVRTAVVSSGEYIPRYDPNRELMNDLRRHMPASGIELGFQSRGQSGSLFSSPPLDVLGRPVAEPSILPLLNAPSVRAGRRMAQRDMGRLGYQQAVLFPEDLDAFERYLANPPTEGRQAARWEAVYKHVRKTVSNLNARGEYVGGWPGGFPAMSDQERYAAGIASNPGMLGRVQPVDYPLQAASYASDEPIPGSDIIGRRRIVSARPAHDWRTIGSLGWPAEPTSGMRYGKAKILSITEGPEADDVYYQGLEDRPDMDFGLGGVRQEDPYLAAEEIGGLRDEILSSLMTTKMPLSQRQAQFILTEFSKHGNVARNVFRRQEASLRELRQHNSFVNASAKLDVAGLGSVGMLDRSSVRTAAAVAARAYAAEKQSRARSTMDELNEWLNKPLPPDEPRVTGGSPKQLDLPLGNTHAQDTPARSSSPTLTPVHGGRRGEAVDENGVHYINGIPETELPSSDPSRWANRAEERVEWEEVDRINQQFETGSRAASGTRAPDPSEMFFDPGTTHRRGSGGTSRGSQPPAAPPPPPAPPSFPPPPDEPPDEPPAGPSEPDDPSDDNLRSSNPVQSASTPRGDRAPSTSAGQRSALQSWGFTQSLYSVDAEGRASTPFDYRNPIVMSGGRKYRLDPSRPESVDGGNIPVFDTETGEITSIKSSSVTHFKLAGKEEFYPINPVGIPGGPLLGGPRGTGGSDREPSPDDLSSGMIDKIRPDLRKLGYSNEDINNMSLADATDIIVNGYQAGPNAARRRGIPMMITHDMRKQLRGVGFSDDEIKNMTPQDAWDAIGAANTSRFVANASTVGSGAPPAPPAPPAGPSGPIGNLGWPSGSGWGGGGGSSQPPQGPPSSTSASYPNPHSATPAARATNAAARAAGQRVAQGQAYVGTVSNADVTSAAIGATSLIARKNIHPISSQYGTGHMQNWDTGINDYTSGYFDDASGSVTISPGSITGGLNLARSAVLHSVSTPLPTNTDDAMATVVKRIDKFITDHVKTRIEEAKKAAGGDTEKFAQDVREIYQESYIGKDLARTAKGKIQREIGASELYNERAYSSMQVAQSSLQKLMDYDPELAASIQRDFGGPGEFLSAGGGIMTTSKGSYDITGDWGGFSDGGDRGGGQRYGGLFRHPIGRAVYAMYIGRAAWRQTGAPAFAGSEEYAKYMDLQIPLMNMMAGGAPESGLRATDAGALMRMADTQRYFQRGAFEQLGGISDAVYGFTGGSPAFARGVAGVGTGLGLAVAGQVMTATAPLLGGGFGLIGGGMAGAAASAPLAGLASATAAAGAGLTGIGLALAGGVIGMEAYNYFAQPERPVSIGNVTRDLSGNVIRARAEAQYYRDRGVRDVLGGTWASSQDVSGIRPPTEDDLRQYMDVREQSIAYYEGRNKTLDDAAAISDAISNITGETGDAAYSYVLGLSRMTGLRGDSLQRFAMSLSGDAARLGMSSANNLQAGVSVAQRLGVLPGAQTQNFLSSAWIGTTDQDRYMMELAAGRMAAAGSQIGGYYSDPTAGSRLATQLGLQRQQDTARVQQFSALAAMSGMDLDRVLGSYGVAPSGGGAPITTTITAGTALAGYSMMQSQFQNQMMAPVMQRLTMSGQYSMMDAAGMLSGLGLNDQQMYNLTQAGQGNLRAMSWNAHESGTYLNRFYNLAGQPIFQTSGTDFMRWAQANYGAGTISSLGSNVGSLMQAANVGNMSVGMADFGKAFFGPEVGDWFVNAFMEGGLYGVQDAYAQKMYGYQMAGIGVQGARLALQEQFYWGQQDGGTWSSPTAGSMWGLEDIQRRYQHRSQLAEFRATEQRMDLTSLFGQRQEALTRERMDIGQEQQRWQFGFDYAGSMLSRGWAMEDRQYEDTMRGLSFEWKMDDLNEAIRRSSGYDRKRLLVQRDRATTTQSLEDEQLDKRRDRQEQLWSREDERFSKQKSYMEEMSRLDNEQFDLGVERRETFETLDREDFDRRVDDYYRMRDLQTQMMELQRKHQYDQIQLSKQSLGVQAAAAQAQHEYEEGIKKINRVWEEGIGRIQQLGEFDQTRLTLRALEDTIRTADEAKRGPIDAIRQMIMASDAVDRSKPDAITRMIWAINNLSTAKASALIDLLNDITTIPGAGGP